MFGLLYHQPLSYMGYSYPTWAEWLGWGLATSSILMIPLVAIITLIRTPGTLREVKIKMLFLCYLFFLCCAVANNAD
jgi:Sodium:neurotransmitter symporter family